jgi:hypothetical protein
MVGLAGLLGGCLVGLGSVDGARAGSSTPGGAAGVAATPGAPAPSHTGRGMPTHSAGSTGSPTFRGVAGTAPPHTGPQGSPAAGSTPRGTPATTPGTTPGTTPRGAAPVAPTAAAGTNDRNPTWRHDSRSWHEWDTSWGDPSFRRDHERDSRHEHVEDRDHRFHDDFHFDEFRSEDRDFRHDCDVLIGIHTVRALLDFLDGETSLRDFFELHGDLYDFLVHHPDLLEDFDGDCTFIDLHS